MRLPAEQSRVLLEWARASLRHALGGELAPRPAAPWADRMGATFVTLRWADTDALQGCIGTLEPRRSLLDDIAENVVAAGVRDGRGKVLSLADVDALDLEISILSPLERLPVSTEEEAVAAIRPGVDGILLQMGMRRGTFLPSMWPRLRTTRAFLAALKQKAGIRPQQWSPDTRVWRYEVDKYEAPAPRRAA